MLGVKNQGTVSLVCKIKGGGLLEPFSADREHRTGVGSLHSGEKSLG